MVGLSNLEGILKALNKKYGEGTIVRAVDAKALEVERIPREFDIRYCYRWRNTRE